MELLLAHNADVNARDFDGRTVLMYACLSTNVAVAESLLRHGANVTWQDRQGKEYVESLHLFFKFWLTHVNINNCSIGLYLSRKVQTLFEELNICIKLLPISSSNHISVQLTVLFMLLVR